MFTKQRTEDDLPPATLTFHLQARRYAIKDRRQTRLAPLRQGYRFHDAPSPTAG